MAETKDKKQKVEEKPKKPLLEKASAKTEAVAEKKTEKSIDEKVKKEVPKKQEKPVTKPNISEKSKKDIVKSSEKIEASKEEKPKKSVFNFKLFDIWDASGIVVSDIGLRDYMNVKPILVPFTAGRSIKKQFWKSKKPIVERLILKLMVSGHRGKKHWRMSRSFTGKYLTITNQIIDTFKLIEKKTNKNPIQVFVDSLCVGSPREGITAVEYGGVRYPKAVDLSPQRRIDLTLRWLTQGAYAKKSASKGHESVSHFLAEEIILTASNDSKSNIISKKYELERQASASR